MEREIFWKYRHADREAIALINFAPLVLFSEAKLTTSLVKYLEAVDNLHSTCFLNKILNSTQFKSDICMVSATTTEDRWQQMKQKNFYTDETDWVILPCWFKKAFYESRYIVTPKNKNSNSLILRKKAISATNFLNEGIIRY